MLAKIIIIARFILLIQDYSRMVYENIILNITTPGIFYNTPISTIGCETANFALVCICSHFYHFNFHLVPA